MGMFCRDNPPVKRFDTTFEILFLSRSKQWWFIILFIYLSKNRTLCGLMTTLALRPDLKEPLNQLR